MEESEVPIDHAEEDIHEHARRSQEKWILGVALTAALLAAFAAVTSLLAGPHSNETMIERIRALMGLDMSGRN